MAVLAGGRSTRMGRDKAQLVHEGATLLERQVALGWQLAPEAVFVVGRTQAELGSLRARGLPDERPGQGPLGGLATVLCVASVAHVVVLAVDMPALSVTFLQRILGLRLPGIGVVPRTARGWEPMVGIFPPSLAAAAGSAVAAGELGFGRFVERAVRDGSLCGYLVASEEEALLENWNSPEDVNRRGRQSAAGGAG
ncbi:MAG TPA: molybdenum cofactor guanylyltransferase [Opitutaceae bacterium]|nr:molybdenum cofactor guanylyltransferase [Opitutaceae bacterium]